MRKTLLVLVAILLAVPAAAQLSDIESLGKQIFFDQNLSAHQNQSCASCHDPSVGWTGPGWGSPAGGVVEGSIAGRFGNRKPPSSAYATLSPVLHVGGSKRNPRFIGGNFWDGRATGVTLNSPAAEQAKGPFLNPLEHALASAAEVVSRVCTASYAGLFQKVYGNTICTGSTDTAYTAIARAIAAYEASAESNAFTSKYDYYLAGKAKLTAAEKRGLNLFNGGGKCSQCHVVGSKNQDALFTDFGYDNLGVPRNPDNPFYNQAAFNPAGIAWIDEGLGGFLKTTSQWSAYANANLGKQKVPTLRNVARRPTPGFQKNYGHNGYFKSLKGIVHFYNTRDAKPPCASAFVREADALAQNCWPAPEVGVNVNNQHLGDLKLTSADEDAIVIFLETLTDGYQP